MKVKEDEIPELIRQGKDREVVPVLYKKVFPLVKKYIITHKGRQEDAADVFQDAIMLFYKQVIKKEYNEQYKVFGYLFRISLNRWLNKLKKDKRMDLIEEIENMEIEDTTTPSDFIYVDNNDNIIKNLFSGIGDKCVELLTLTVYYNLLLEDVVLRMGFSSVDAVKMQQHRCKQKLVKEIEKNPALIDKIKGL